MMNNRSVPTNVLLPHLVYKDVGEAIDWLGRTFGFVEHYRYGDPDDPQGAQVRYGEHAWMMLSRTREDRRTPSELGGVHSSLTIFVEDVDAQYERVRAAGAEITEELQETMYGERQFGVRDIGGHGWLFSTHVKDVSPDEWGATIANPTG